MLRSLDQKLPIRPAKFAHAVLRTRNLAESAAWYKLVVGGMKTVFGNDFVEFLTYDDEHHRIALIQTGVQQAAPVGAAGLDHLAYSFDTLGDLFSTYRRLEAAGVKPVWCINHGPTTSFYYEDPDGNRVEFQYDNFPDAADLQRFMASGAFRQNPIGVEFDPEKLIARYEQGDPLEELVKQGAA